MTRKSARLDSTKLGMDGRHRVELQTSAMATVETLVPSTKQRVTAILHHDERLYVGLASGVLEVYLYSPPSRPQLLATHPLARRQLDQLAVLPVLNYLAVLAGES
ncbi:hypothetical protein I310_04659, partial [Cryptococcus deuterogattii CA1014]